MSKEKFKLNDAGKPSYTGVDADTRLSKLEFHTPEHVFESDVQVALHTNIGTITVLDRLTGFSGGIRDIETGYRSPEGEFWLASGGYDVRDQNFKTIGEAIVWIQDKANTCIPNFD